MYVISRLNYSADLLIKIKDEPSILDDPWAMVCPLFVHSFLLELKASECKKKMHNIKKWKQKIKLPWNKREGILV